MNNEKRKRLGSAVERLAQVLEVVDDVTDEEQECLDSFPESLQNNSRYEKMENAIDMLIDASEQINGAIDCIQEAMS
jgi:ABC-type transporter Mla subunit MlaD